MGVVICRFLGREWVSLRVDCVGSVFYFEFLFSCVGEGRVLFCFCVEIKNGK